MGLYFARTKNDDMAHSIRDSVSNPTIAREAYLVNFRVKGKNSVVAVKRGHHALILDLDGASTDDLLRYQYFRI